MHALAQSSLFFNYYNQELFWTNSKNSYWTHLLHDTKNLYADIWGPPWLNTFLFTRSYSALCTSQFQNPKPTLYRAKLRSNALGMLGGGGWGMCGFGIDWYINQ